MDAPVAAQATAATRRGGVTRQALLDSTLELIASTGYAATTTQAVLDSSGISRGSLLHQFRTRDALIVAAAVEAVDRMFEGVREGLADAADPIAALRQYPSVLWEVQNQVPARAYAEIQLASRWEQSLQQALRPVLQQIGLRVGRQIQDVAQALGLTNVNELIVEVAALISAMQGLAIGSSLASDPNVTREILGALTAHYTKCLDACLDGSGTT